MRRQTLTPNRMALALAIGLIITAVALPLIVRRRGRIAGDEELIDRKRQQTALHWHPSHERH